MRAPDCGDHAAERPYVRDVSAAAFARAAALFRAAGDLARLRLLHRLDAGECCVSELAEASATKLSTLSQQLRVLHAERIVKRRREGKHIYYALADVHVRDLIRAALDHAGEPLVARPAPQRKQRS
jgi:ArsR family transcriptional regulator